MTVDFKDGLTIDFETPKTALEPIIVTRCLPNQSPKRIGRIYQLYSDNGEGVIMYMAVSDKFQDICPQTIDWQFVENNFGNYARELIKQEKEQAFIKQAEREDEIENIRQSKKQKVKQLNK